MDDPVHVPTPPAAQTHPIEQLSTIAESLARASDVTAALDTLAVDLARALETRASIFERTGRGWMLVSQSDRRLRATLADLDHALSTLPPRVPVSSVDLRASGEGIWTSLSLDRPGGLPLVVLIAGDWQSLHETLTALAILLAFALRYVRESSDRNEAGRILVRAYAIGRRLSRLGDLESVCGRLVEHVARALDAERVGLALYRADEDCLAMAATRGYPAAAVRDVRIKPGAWVVGHVYLTGRAVLVRDSTQIQGVPPEGRHYRTSSFAAVPMLVGTETVGVLMATDKRDGSAFDQKDALAMRTYSVSAALAIQATRAREDANRLAHAATFDALTGLFNRHYFNERLHEELERARRSSAPVTLLLLDIDDFKSVNDTMGHQVGDAILSAVGGILHSTVRVFDVCARFGGDEFAILTPGSDHDQAAATAERIRQRVASHASFPSGARLTISIGVAVFNDGDASEDLIRRADRFLYLAKAQGKNRVCRGLEIAKVERMPALRRNDGESA